MRSFTAFLIVVVLIILGCLLPFIIEFLATGRPTRRWHFGHITNPFWTAMEVRGRLRDQEVVAVCVVSGLALLVSLRRFVVDTREVLAASARRRDLAA